MVIFHSILTELLNSLQYHDALKISDDRLCKIKMIGEIVKILPRRVPRLASY